MLNKGMTLAGYERALNRVGPAGAQMVDALRTVAEVTRYDDSLLDKDPQTLTEAEWATIDTMRGALVALIKENSKLFAEAQAADRMLYPLENMLGVSLEMD